MRSRHHAAITQAKDRPDLVKLLGLGVVLIVLLAGGLFACNRITRGCGDVRRYSLAVDPSIEPVVSKVLGQTSAEDLDCASFDVSSTPSAVVAAALGRPGAPAVWIPDSGLWITKAGRRTGQLVDVANQSVAASPVVVVGHRDALPTLPTWQATLETKGLTIGDPLGDSAANAPILGALAEIDMGKSNKDQLSAALIPLAQAQAANPDLAAADKRLTDVQHGTGFTVTSEQELVHYTNNVPDAGLGATTPATGTFLLDYPVAVTQAPGPDHDAAKPAASALAVALAGDAGKKALSEAGFRTPDRAPLDGGRGVGQVNQLTVVDPSMLESTLRSYAAVALPTRGVILVDVSGSMASPTGSGTRVELTTQAIDTGVTLFPPNAQLAFWAFSIDLGGPGQDWRELVPMRRLDAQVDGRSQRDAMTAASNSLGGLVANAGTGLYDSTLAAWRRVKDGWDPRASNVVVVFTDGTNEDPNSISLSELLDTFKREQDPAKPVKVVAIGITDDADAGVLQQIATATDGTSYIARNPADIANVYSNALRARAAGN